MARIHYCRDYRDMSRQAATRIIAAVAARSDSLLCAAAGESPVGLYQELIREAGSKPDLFRHLRVVKLDEWLQLPAGDAATCEYFLKSRLLDPLKIEAERYIAFDPQTADPLRECGRISGDLARHGPIDLCVLGLGKNGHIGLIEPAPCLQPHCHVTKLSEQTLKHQMLGSARTAPTHGLTLGIADILAARKIVLLITGEGKERAIARFLNGTVTTEAPATFLWLHQDLEVFLDDASRQDP
jgi:galactosamine-6-phosphate isomerase